MAEAPISIDYTLCMADAVGAHGGLHARELDAEAPAFRQAVERVQAEVASGRLGFWKLPEDAHLLEAVERVCAALPEVDDVLVLGIGGSSLGTRAIYQALHAPAELPGPADHPRLHLPDNSDPWLLSHLLESLSPERCAVLAISKSGGTVETAAQLLVVRAWLDATLAPEQVRKRLVYITDPDKGPLRDLTRRDGVSSLEVPPAVGGRFSALSAVGLLPARLSGIDVQALQAGARQMAKRCETPVLRDNPAGILAATHVLQHRLRGRSIHVMMPYGDRLRAFADWFVQLWAESLGKRVRRNGQVVENGPTPLPAIGATDQHAQVQLFMEGPRDKLVTFLQVAEVERDLAIPEAPGPFAYLGGGSLARLLDAERQGTTQALARDGRPSLTLRLERLDASALGGLIFLYEAATAFAGELYDIDAFDQPGVEEGKRLAFGLLGRQGYEPAAEEIRQAQAQRPSGYRI